MKYSFAALAVLAAVEASPFPQGITQSIAPSAPAPPGCTPTYSGTFGIAVMNATAGAGAAPVSQSADGQPGATTGAAGVSTIADGQPQAPTGGAVVSTIADGQPQVPTSTIGGQITQISDGQVQAPTKTMGPINQINDGQIQNQVPTSKATPVNQISDGQIQQPTAATPVNQITDGQIQQPTAATPVNQITDGQIQQPTAATPVNQITDGQIQQPTSVTAVNTIADGQPQASGSAVGTQKDGQPTAGAGGSGGSGAGTKYVACKASDSLQVTLANGVLKDNQGRTGYIASNYQFQFDGPPQAGAIYTAGFSVCGNGSLALGGSTTFYQCLSGNFYNLYDRSWAAQCSPINIQIVDLINC